MPKVRNLPSERLRQTRMRLISASLLALASTLAVSQVGGGSAAYGNRGQSGADTARNQELAKRNAPYERGRHVDASVLMNLKPDEYIAVFGLSHEGKTLADARTSLDAALAKFQAGLKALNIAQTETFVDFVAQNRIYGFDTSQPDIAKEQVVGFEIKKNISIRYKSHAMLDRIISAAADAQVFDLVKVDYVLKDVAAARKRINEEAAKVIKAKVAEQTKLYGVKATPAVQVLPSQVTFYYPVEMYDAYIAQESEDTYGYRQNMTIHRARKPKTFYYNPLAAKDFDAVVNPSVLEPCVQVATYVRAKY